MSRVLRWRSKIHYCLSDFFYLEEVHLYLGLHFNQGFRESSNTDTGFNKKRGTNYYFFADDFVPVGTIILLLKTCHLSDRTK